MMRYYLGSDRTAVSPVIAVILMVAITVVLAGVVFIWAGSFANDADGGPEFFNVKPEITTNGGNHPTQTLTIEIISGFIYWPNFYVRLDGVDLNLTSTEVKAGDIENLDVPNGDFPSGGLNLQIGSSYRLKIISIDNNRIVFNDDIICQNG